MTFHAEQILPRLDEFVAFARVRLGDPHLAADAVQDAVVKALARDGQLADDERVVAWFYRILRNVIADLRQRQQRQSPTLGDDQSATAEDEATACCCVTALVDQLSPAHARALRLVDLDGASLESAAAGEGITVGALKVRRHLARAQLRELVQTACRVCAVHGCLDCLC